MQIFNGSAIHVINCLKGNVVSAPEYEQIIPSLDLNPVYSEAKASSHTYNAGHTKYSSMTASWDAKLYEVVTVTG